MTAPSQERLRPLLSDVHRYWLGPLPSPAYLPHDRKDIWFKQSDATDAHIREHFGAAIPEAAATAWDLDGLKREEQIALVVLFDQFPRNLFRGTAQAFAHDDAARAIAGRLISGGKDRFALIEQLFLAIPFEHSEDIADQDYAIWLMSGIAVEAAEAFPDYARWALDSFIVHRDIIRRFGRFPYRNAALGRESTPEEAAFLAEKAGVNPSNPTEEHRFGGSAAQVPSRSGGKTCASGVTAARLGVMSASTRRPTHSSPPRSIAWKAALSQVSARWARPLNQTRPLP